MPIPESRNPRLVSRIGASRSSYNSKDPPEFGSRGIPDSREALPSFSEYLELFHLKAHSLYLRDRETLKYELSVTRTAQTSIAEKVLLEPDSNEWLSRLESYIEFAAHLEKGLSSQKRKLYSRYEREYDKFLREELGKVRAEERKARADEWDRQSAEWNKVFEGLLEAVESERRYGRERPSTPTPDSCSPQREVRTTTPNLARTPDHSGPPPSIPIEGTRPRTTFVDNQKVSKPEIPNPPERVQLTRSKASPSSTKPDPPSAPRRLKTSPPSVSRELLPARKLMTEGRKPLKSSLETASTDAISGPSPRSRERAKAREQPNRTVLDREPPKGSSLMGAKPASRVVSAPAPKRVDTRTSGEPPIRKTRVDVKKDAKARRHSPMPKAAPTLLKSTPVSSIRARTPASSFPSSRMISTLHTTDVVNTRRGGKGTACWNPETRTLSRVSRSTTLPSSQAIPTRDSLKSSVVSTRRAVSETTHHAVETRTRVSSKAATPRFGKIPSADSIERSDDRSDAIIGPAVEQALTLFSSEVGERQRVPDTIISIHNGEKRDVRSPSPKTTRKWSNPSYAPARVDGGGQLARAAAYIRERSTQRSPAFDKFICRTPKAPPDKTTESDTIQHVPDVASEGKRFSEAVESLQPHSDIETFPSQPETQRLSKEHSESIPKFAEPACDTSDVGGQERRTVQLVEAVEADRRSAERLEEIKEISDELVMPALEEAEQPPNLMERQLELLAVSKAETSAQSHSPIPSAALTPLAPLPAFLSQAMSINQPSLGLDWLLLKPPDGARIERCLHDTVNSKPFPSVEQHSPEPLVVVIPPVPKPVSTRAYSCCIQNATVAAKRRIVDVVSTNVDVGATKHLLLTKAAFALT